jgi:hypothetical protein
MGRQHPSAVGFSISDLLPGSGGISGSVAKKVKAVAELKSKIDAIEKVSEGIRASEIPNQIAASDAKKLADLATKALLNYVQVAAKAAQAMPEIRDRIMSSRESVQRDYLRMIKGRILDPALKVGPEGAVDGSMVKANIALFLNHVAGGYGALLFFEEIRPGFLDMIPSSVMRVIIDIGELIVKIAKFVAKTLKDGLDDAKKFVLTLVDVLKWGTIAGGLYLLYGVLKEKDKI